MKLIGKIHWEWLHKLRHGRKYDLSLADWYDVSKALHEGYYIILTSRKTHLSTYACRLGHLFLTGKWGFYSHALVNVESERATYGFADFRFMEAIGRGVKFSTWFQVMNCDAICILKPLRYTNEELNKTIGVVYQEEGKKYDDRFKVYDSKRLSCVELARIRLMSLPDYREKMRIFEYMIKHEKNLTPQMFRDCPDFEVLLEIKK